MRFFNPKFTVILLLVSVVFFGIPTAPAQAVFLLDDLVNWLLGGILSVENNLLAAVATMMDNVMQPQSLLNQEFIKAGWAITRDFANMFFILILLGVALSFILFPKYQLKSALPRLLVVALLINFSLPIAGVFLDAANILTSF
ncbi:hypothetical protein HY249_01510, partial [Candidatus Azambacteria bacterium]|nr:hypothetical protein [Candidatus Azambacteria bacterium]